MMRVGMLASVTHPYPPSGYGPWERVTHDLTECLVSEGHEVTLFAPAGSVPGRVWWRPLRAAHIFGAGSQNRRAGPYGQARTLGLVAIEALASGTPVIAWRMGALPEIVHHGLTGFDSPDRVAGAVERLNEISRLRCRMEAESRFSAERMAHDHLEMYSRVVGHTISDTSSRSEVEANPIP